MKSKLMKARCSVAIVAICVQSCLAFWPTVTRADVREYPESCTGLYQASLALQEDLDSYEMALNDGSASSQRSLYQRVEDDEASLPQIYRNDDNCDDSTRYLYDWSNVRYLINLIGRHGESGDRDLSSCMLYLGALINAWKITDYETKVQLWQYAKRIRKYYVRDHINLTPEDDATLHRVESL